MSFSNDTNGNNPLPMPSTSFSTSVAEQVMPKRFPMPPARGKYYPPKKEETFQPYTKGFKTSVNPLAKEAQHTAVIRAAGGEVWADSTLADWDSNDYRLFVGNLALEVKDETLAKAFSKYSSVQKVHVVKDKTSSRNKGYGFVSFRDADDYAKAFREMNGKYIGCRPICIKKSNWKDRNVTQTHAKKLIKAGTYSIKK